MRIRPYAIGDDRGFHRAAAESLTDLFPWMPCFHPGYSAEEAAGWVDRQLEAFPSGEMYEFVIVDDAEEIAGGCGLNQIDRANRRANLGYWIRSASTGRGYATEAVKLLVAWAAEHTDLQRIEVVVSVGNVASLRVAEKAGAVRECILAARLLINDVFHDAVMHSFVRGRNMTA